MNFLLMAKFSFPCPENSHQSTRYRNELLPEPRGKEKKVAVEPPVVACGWRARRARAVLSVRKSLEIECNWGLRSARRRFLIRYEVLVVKGYATSPSPGRCQSEVSTWHSCRACLWLRNISKVPIVALGPDQISIGEDWELELPNK
jgi:hypothetical protein